MTKFDFVSLDSPVFDEISAYIEAHKDELKQYSETLEVDYPTYRVAAEAGQLMALTLRHDGNLVGFSIFYLSPRLRSRLEIDATSQGLYIEQAFRKKYGLRMIMEGQKYLDRFGIKETNYQNDNEAFGRLLRKLGFVKKTVIWSKKNG